MTKRQEINERVYGSAVKQITDHSDFEIINAAKFFLYGVKIKKCLRWVFAITIPRIDNWYRRNFCGSLGGSWLVMAQDNHIRVTRDNSDTIFQRFAFNSRRKMSCAFGGNYLPAELKHCRFERKPGAGTRFVEYTGKDFIPQKFRNFTLPICLFEFFCFFENIYKLFSV